MLLLLANEGWSNKRERPLGSRSSLVRVLTCAEVCCNGYFHVAQNRSCKLVHWESMFDRKPS